MRNISEVKPFVSELEFFYVPAVRVIGKEVRNGGVLGNTAPDLWNETYASGEFDRLLKMPRLVQGGFGWTCEYDEKTQTFSYIVCIMAPAGSPVPEGFTYRDIRETICVKGLFDESIEDTIERAKKLGYVTNWEQHGWNAELYIDEEEKNLPKTDCTTPWHWLLPVKKIS